MNEAEIRERLRKIEALFAKAGTEGERAAAEAAAERIRAKLWDAQRSGASVEMRFALGDVWSRQLFVALCRRYGLAAYRYRRQRHTTVMLKAPEPFINEILWPEFQELNQVLFDYLAEVTERIISEAVFAHTGEAEEVDDPAQIARS